MSNWHLVNLESLAQFRAEVSLFNPVRLSLTQRRSGQSPFITETWYLRLQGWLSHTDLGQLTQLFQVQLGPDGEPLHPQGRALREALPQARELVQAYLAAAGYIVRGGFYATPDDLKPLDAQFECLKWDYDREAETVSVRLMEALADVVYVTVVGRRPEETFKETFCTWGSGADLQAAIRDALQRELRVEVSDLEVLAVFDGWHERLDVAYVQPSQQEFDAESAPSDDAGGVTLQPHRTAELEGLADAFADAEAEFLGQFEVTTCPYCGEETGLITPSGRIVCSCWTNPAEELVDELQSGVDGARWEFFHEDNLPGDWPEELGIHLRRGTADVEVRITPYPDRLSLEFLDPAGTPYETEVSLTVVEPDGVRVELENRDARVSVSGGESCSACSK